MKVCYPIVDKKAKEKFAGTIFYTIENVGGIAPQFQAIT
jgi:hypothetical protein